MVEVKDPESHRIYPLFIKLPSSYGRGNKKYPVIYMTDAWYSFQIVSGATRYPMKFDWMKEAIIVGISYSKGSIGSSSRNRDYTPTYFPDWETRTGDAEKHMEFIENHVFSYIEKNYQADSKNRTYIGNSFGGLFGTYVLLTNPDMFKNYIIGSPSYWWDHGYIFKLESEFAKKKQKVDANVFISVGELETAAPLAGYDMVEDAKAFHKRMSGWNQENLRSKLIVIPEANHRTAFPTTAIQGLHWILGKKRDKPLSHFKSSRK